MNSLWRSPRLPSVEPKKIVAVVVAYNRAALLAEALDALASQTRLVDDIVVVDNASTDDTWSMAAYHDARPHVLTMTRNTGGAGGFAAGLDLAIRRYGAAFVWLMDDDTIPAPDALEKLLDAEAKFAGCVDILASKAVWIDGREHPMNTPRQRWRASADAVSRAAQVGAVQIRTTSFVSMLVRAATVRRVGLPQADFFIWNDDFEFSARVLKNGTGLHVPASVVVHKTAKFGSAEVDPGDRFFYEVRNKIWTFLEPETFSALDRLAYLGATIMRWLRTIRSSSDPVRLLTTGVRGLRDGVFTRPRPTSSVLNQTLPPRPPKQ